MKKQLALLFMALLTSTSFALHPDVQYIPTYDSQGKIIGIMGASIYEIRKDGNHCTEHVEMNMIVQRVEPSSGKVKNVILQGADGQDYTLHLKTYLDTLPQNERLLTQALFKPGTKFFTLYFFCPGQKIDYFFLVNRLDDQKTALEPLWKIGGWDINVTEHYIFIAHKSEPSHSLNATMLLTLNCDKEKDELLLKLVTVDQTNKKWLTYYPKNKTPVIFFSDDISDEFLEDWEFDANGRTIIIAPHRVNLIEKIEQADRLTIGVNSIEQGALFFTFRLESKEALHKVLQVCHFD